MIHANNTHKFVNCSILVGSLRIQRSTFLGYAIMLALLLLFSNFNGKFYDAAYYFFYCCCYDDDVGLMCVFLYAQRYASAVYAIILCLSVFFRNVWLRGYSRLTYTVMKGNSTISARIRVRPSGTILTAKDPKQQKS